MVQYDWNDMKDRREICMKNMTLQYPLWSAAMLSIHMKVIKTCFSLIMTSRHILTTCYGYCKEALEASGYKDKGYVDNFTISHDRAIISVKHKDGGFSKTYEISQDGKGIVIPE